MPWRCLIVRRLHACSHAQRARQRHTQLCSLSLETFEFEFELKLDLDEEETSTLPLAGISGRRTMNRAPAHTPGSDSTLMSPPAPTISRQQARSRQHVRTVQLRQLLGDGEAQAGVVLRSVSLLVEGREYRWQRGWRDAGAVVGDDQLQEIARRRRRRWQLWRVPRLLLLQFDLFLLFLSLLLW